jgi:hypothetical protein
MSGRIRRSKDRRDGLETETHFRRKTELRKT